MRPTSFQAPVGYLAFDDDSIIRDANDEAAALLGYTREELSGTSLLDVLSRPARMFFSSQVLPTLGQNARVEETYISFRTKSSDLLPVLLNAERREGGSPAANCCVFLPMRRRQLFEQELLDARAAAEAARAREQAALTRIQAMQNKLALQDRLATLGTLAAGIIHEINNPLSYVSANLQLFEETLGDGLPSHDAEALTMIQDAREGVRRINEILSAVRSYSRFSGARREAVDLAEVVATSVRMTDHQLRKKARVELDLQPRALVEGDETRLNQVVVNLLINAGQAFAAAKPEQNRIALTLRAPPAARVALEIRDNGPGIPDELQARVFEPFFTTKPVGEGTGLGLSICRDIIDSMGGEFTLQSKPGLGACFRIELPPARALLHGP